MTLNELVETWCPPADFKRSTITLDDGTSAEVWLDKGRAGYANKDYVHIVYDDSVSLFSGKGPRAKLIEHATSGTHFRRLVGSKNVVVLKELD